MNNITAAFADELIKIAAPGGPSLVGATIGDQTSLENQEAALMEELSKTVRGRDLGKSYFADAQKLRAGESRYGDFTSNLELNDYEADRLRRIAKRTKNKAEADRLMRKVRIHEQGSRIAKIRAGLDPDKKIVHRFSQKGDHQFFIDGKEFDWRAAKDKAESYNSRKAVSGGSMGSIGIGRDAIGAGNSEGDRSFAERVWGKKDRDKAPKPSPNVIGQARQKAREGKTQRRAVPIAPGIVAYGNKSEGYRASIGRGKEKRIDDKTVKSLGDTIKNIRSAVYEAASKENARQSAKSNAVKRRPKKAPPLTVTPEKRVMKELPGRTFESPLGTGKDLPSVPAPTKLKTV